MKIYTIEDFKKFERDEYGRIICPTGDYTQIKSFGEWCSFGKGCNLNNNLKFENITEQVLDIFKIDRIGSRKGCTYFFQTATQIYVRCGCFFGTINEFKKAVKKTHENNPQYLKEYLGAIKYIKSICEIKENGK